MVRCSPQALDLNRSNKIKFYMQRIVNMIIPSSIMKTIRYTKNEVCIKDFFSKCDQICRTLRIWSHLLKKSLMENFIFLDSDPSQNKPFFKDSVVMTSRLLSINPFLREAVCKSRDKCKI